MISPTHVQTMALYNRWQNRSIYGAADKLTDEQRREHRGAFFDSIQGTLNHILWGDRLWMSRLAGWEPPAVRSGRDSPQYFSEWNELKQQRQATDQALIIWASALTPAALEGDFSYFSPAAGREITKPRWLFVTHLFNHQTHHRGQVHCLLTQLGVTPEDTDLPFRPEV